MRTNEQELKDYEDLVCEVSQTEGYPQGRFLKVNKVEKILQTLFYSLVHFLWPGVFSWLPTSSVVTHQYTRANSSSVRASLIINLILIAFTRYCPLILTVVDQTLSGWGVTCPLRRAAWSSALRIFQVTYSWNMTSFLVNGFKNHWNILRVIFSVGAG